MQPFANRSAMPDFRVLFESAPGLYLVLDPELKIVAVSDAYLRATMTTRDGVMGRGVFDVFPDNPGDPQATGERNLRSSLARVLETRSADTMAVQKYDIRRPDSEGGAFEERYWSPINSPVLGAGGEVVYLIHRVEDVTDFIRLKQAGSEREEKTEALRTHAEQAEAEVYRSAQQLGAANQQLRTANEKLAALYQQVALLMARAGDELRSGAEHAERWGPRQNPMSPEEMLVRIGELIVGHTRLEEQLRQSQKMEAVGSLAGGVAHDFNNLLTVVAGYTALMREDLPPGADLENLDEIDKAVMRAAALTRKLLAFSRKQVLEPRVIDLNHVVSGMEEMLRRLIGENVQLVTVLGGGLGMVRADPGQIEQVVMNLVVNARDAMPGGGRIVIETSSARIEPGGEESALRPGAYACVSVIDNGHGMDAGTAARIFEPFFTTKEPGKGTGLGLSMAHGIAQQSGGALTVESTPGAGTTFCLYLPLTDASAGEDRPPKPSAARPGGAATILLVEDEAPLRKLVATVLAAAGHRVLEAANGDEALRLAQKHPERIDLLLTDVVMPGMSGSEAAARIRQARPEVLVLLMSAYNRDLPDREILQPGAAFLPKPFTPRVLLSRISELLGTRREGAADQSQAAGS